MKFIVHDNFKNIQNDILKSIDDFDTKGELLVKGSRNTIKIFPVNEFQLNIKAFKTPNFINRIVYKYIRNSKAKRSYQYALKLINKKIGTPFPIAYAEFNSGVGLGKSFYVCEHIATEYTYRDLVVNPLLENHEVILRAFTRFCFQMHEAGIEFKDHSPGNTLIQVKGNGLYSFYLVDLNRMKFHNHLSFELRMLNLRRLTPKKEMVEVMANEYAKLYQTKTEQEIFELLWKNTSEFQAKFHRKQRLKKKIKFWRK